MGADAAVEEQFGPYLVYERLGVGGMATVHRALERGIEGFERIVALKRLLPHLAADASFIKSFVREAKLASLLNHINIVQIFELGRVGTQYFISMEHIDGRDIRRILRHARKAAGAPPIHVTVGMLLQLCDALDYAHHKVDDTGHPLGLVHRDVSPSNVLVTRAGQIKVIDFGIAKAQSAQLRTQTGRVKGKLAYMAPEAIVGKDLDARSDLFAVGVIGHELLTARPLFTSKNEYQTLIKVQRGDIASPSTFNPKCPPELDAIVLRALARDPDDRFRHASELRDALNAVRKQYNLQTTHRDIATWIEWAFSREVPSSSFAIDHPLGALDARSSPRHRPSRHKRSEEDEAVDLAWGGGDEHQSGDPVVLDDVPDVTDKHLSNASSLGADVRLDFDDLADDIPASGPSHGVRPPPAISSRTATASLRPSRPRPATPAPVRISQAVPVQVPRDRSEPVRLGARGAQDDIATTNVGVGVRSVTLPPRVRAITIPPLAGPAAAGIPRTVPSLAPPPPMPSPSSPAPAVSPQATPSSGASEAATRPRGVSATSPPLPRRRATSSSIIPAPARPEIATTEQPPVVIGHEETPRPNEVTTEHTPASSPDEFNQASDTMPTLPPMPALQSSEQLVRSRGPTNPPAHATPAPARSSRPGNPTPAPASSSSPDTPPPRLVTPATELFADPDPAPDPDPELETLRSSAAATAQRVPRASSHNVPLPEVAPRRSTAFRRVLVLLVVLVLAAAVGTAVALYLTRIRDTATTEDQGPAPPPHDKVTGTIKLETVPADATVTIAGKPVHAGSPWNVDLDPGVHQIEIHRDGYKAYLTSIDLAPDEIQTLRVVLDPLTASIDAAVAADAMPTTDAQTSAGGELDPATAAPPPPVPPVPSPPPANPEIVPPTAVSKLSGQLPSAARLGGGALPAVISARLCIDETGQVTSPDVLTELPPRASEGIVDALRSWRYAPYKANGVARAACFVVTLRVK